MRLYKKDTKGKIRVLDITTLGGSIKMSSGLLDGKKVDRLKPCKPKNTGKKNATTAEQQAKVEVVSIVTRKLREGYFKSEAEAEESNIILPMLAKEFEKEEKKVVYPCFAQPKLDGMRCLAIMKNGTITLLSRKNVEITTMEHIKPGLLDRLKDDETILDGELYAHGLSFQENMKLLKKYRKGDSESVKFHIYDHVSAKPFKERNAFLNTLDLDNSDNLQLVETVIINNKEELETYHQECLERGFEGTMVRWGEEAYKVNGRSSNLLKFKDFKDVALPVVDIVESDRVPGHGIIIIEYNGHRSKTGSKISHADRADLWTNREDYIGKTAEIRYFEETDKGGLRFPVFHGFRVDK